MDERFERNCGYVWVTAQVEDLREIDLPRSKRTITVGPTWVWLPWESVRDAVTEGRARVRDDDDRAA